MDRAVQRRLPVSLRMVRQVVEQGQWNRQRIMVETAVQTVQPFDTSSSCSSGRVPVSARTPLCR